MLRLKKTKQYQKLQDSNLEGSVSYSKGFIDLLNQILNDRLEVADKRLENVLESTADNMFATLGARKELKHLLWLLEKTEEG